MHHHKLEMSSPKSRPQVRTPEPRLARCNRGRYFELRGCTVIHANAMLCTTAAMTRSTIFAKCVSTGDNFMAWKCSPTKAASSVMRKAKGWWSALIEWKSSSLAHKQNSFSFIFTFSRVQENQNATNLCKFYGFEVLDFSPSQP